MLMGEKFNEDAYEQVLISLFEKLGYEYECGYDVERDYSEPYYRDDLEASIRRLNPQYDNSVIEEGIRNITNFELASMEEKNEKVTLWMQGGMEVNYQEGGETKTVLLKLVDYTNLNNNRFKVVNQWRVEGEQTKR